MVGSEWKNITSPLCRAKIGNVDIYIASGTELLSWSAERYHRILEELDGKVLRCVNDYDETDVSFSMTSPKTTLLIPWKIEILKTSFVGAEQTTAIVYEPRREGYDDFHYSTDTIRIAENYRERYYSPEDG